MGTTCSAQPGAEEKEEEAGEVEETEGEAEEVGEKTKDRTSRSHPRTLYPFQEKRRSHS